MSIVREEQWMILEEFDNNRRAIINPEDLIEALPDFPETVVSCFARATFNACWLIFSMIC